MNFLILFCVLSLAIDSCFVWASPCDPNWAPYRDEKCFKVLEQAPLQSYVDAVKSCAQEEGSQLVRVDSQEEEDFLVRYLFTQKKIVDNLWLGAKYSGAAFHWEATGQTNLTYSNWATGSPKNREGYCVMMEAHEERRGKWSDEPCQGKNLVLCQKEQNLSLAVMKSILFEMRKNLQQTQTELTHLKTSERQFQEELAHLKANPVPLGFLYTQYPKDKAPSEIWPSVTWNDVSATYENVFFRVAGSQTAAFGTVQEENAPMIDIIHGHDCDFDKYPDDLSTTPTGKCHENGETLSHAFSVDIPKTTGWSAYKYTALTNGGSRLTLTQYHNRGGEVRPRNMAIKVWKRTA